MSFELPKSLKPLIDFAIHVVVGSIVFIIYNCFSRDGLYIVGVKAFDGMIPRWVERTSEYAEMGLFGIDMSLFALFIISEAIRLVRGLWLELMT